jgi:hypothetical protein
MPVSWIQIQYLGHSSHGRKTPPPKTIITTSAIWHRIIEVVAFCENLVMKLSMASVAREVCEGQP